MTPLRAAHATESNVRQRLEQHLSIALSRLRRLGGVVELEARPGVGDNTPVADAVDDIQASASRKIGLATREHASLRPSCPPNEEVRDAAR
jgi:hypothetical protein